MQKRKFLELDSGEIPPVWNIILMPYSDHSNLFNLLNENWKKKRKKKGKRKKDKNVRRKKKNLN